jgi:hypothetical protein
MYSKRVSITWRATFGRPHLDEVVDVDAGVADALRVRAPDPVDPFHGQHLLAALQREELRDLHHRVAVKVVIKVADGRDSWIVLATSQDVTLLKKRGFTMRAMP